MKKKQSAYAVGQVICKCSKKFKLLRKILEIKKSQLTHDCYIQLVGKVPSFSRQPYSEKFDSDICDDF